jgi:hypothetical protein
VRVPLVLLLALAATACRARGETGAPAEDVYRFPHGAAPHAALPCGDCHRLVAEGTTTRPGSDDHAPCDRASCHAPAFASPPGKLCTMCHERVTPSEMGATLPAPFPPRAGARALAAEMSHTIHLDEARLEAKVGFHVSCSDCHVRTDGEQDMGRPGHAACLRCHNDGTAAVTPKLTHCEGCHRRRPADPPRARALIRGDLRFSHEGHDRDRAGAAIPCLTCHPSIERASATGSRSTVTAQVCAGCHGDPRRVPDSARMIRCATCHQRGQGDLAALTLPRSHLVSGFRPDDHTLAFRRDHGAEAELQAPRCATCHAGMSGSRAANCDECHQSMRPTDHTILWREHEHGNEAGVAATRCATCHGGEFCVACHSRPPRSHVGVDFRSSGHAPAARRDLRSCHACHDVAQECASCHAGGLGP